MRIRINGVRVKLNSPNSTLQRSFAIARPLVDPTTVFISHLSEELKQHAASLLTRTETDRLLQRVRDEQPGLVEDLIPTILSDSSRQYPR
jgi:flagellar biosynthesis component FlhA